MNNTIIICTFFCVLLALLLLIFSLFAIGFLIGYRCEEKKIFKRLHKCDENSSYKCDEDTKAKKDWKKFLSYDGSTPNGCE